MKSRLFNTLLFFVVGASLTFGQSQFSIRMLNGYATVKNNGQQKYVEVGWQTTLEKGFSYYILQRSLPGYEVGMSADTNSWVNIARMDTISTTDTIKTYIYSDYPNAAADYGYRVKVTISDSSHLYSTFATVPAWTLTGVSILSQEIPLKYECVSNYPNPFNPSTKISLTLLEAERVSLEIYDLLGRKMETIVDGVISQGTHQYLWDASHYTSGVYLCTLRSKNGTKIAKLLLQK